MAKEALRLATDFEFTVIDGPPHAERIARSCIIASDFVTLPIEPSGLSTWASNLTVQQIKEAQAFKEALKCGFVVSRKIGNTVIGRDIRAMAAEAGIPILSTEVEQRVAFAESMTMGETIFEWSARSAAAREIDHLTDEILSHAYENLHSRPEDPGCQALTISTPSRRAGLGMTAKLRRLSRQPWLERPKSSRNV